MRIIFEDYFYDSHLIEGLLPRDLLSWSADEERAKTTYVGYHFSNTIDEPVFILPKVFIDANWKPFGKEELVKEELLNGIDIDNILGKEDALTISRLSFWLYQAINKYAEKNPKTTILRSANIQEIKSVGDYSCSTLIEVIQSLRCFNHDHQNLFTFIVNQNRSGVHNIDWNKTITKVKPLIQDARPIYWDFINKKKNINFDEEIIVLFYSVMEYLKGKYYFDEPVNFNFNLLSVDQVQDLIDYETGTIYLDKIRHKYFTDKLVQLWQLLYVFFEKEQQIASKGYHEEDVLATSFNNVFEDMIDQLIGSNDLAAVKKNKDGKIIDHLYRDDSLINNGQVYYIADSKYYKESSDLGENSVYKQFTYARNIIQHNLNIFQKDSDDEHYLPAMRDELTEGYNIVPNFFIRASAVGIDGVYDYEKSYLENEFEKDYGKTVTDEITREQIENKLVNYHFANRLFDRDTLVLQTYNINFLYVLAKYVEGGDEIVKAAIRKQFRLDLIQRFDALYNFYKLSPKDDTSSLEELVDKHFRILNGRVICPEKDCGYLILALEKENITTKDYSLYRKSNLILEALRDFKHERFDICKVNGLKY